MSLKMRITFGSLGLFVFTTFSMMTYVSFFLPLTQPIAKIERAIARAYPHSKPRVKILGGEKAADEGMLQIEITTAENPEEKTADARAMAVKSAQFAKLYHPLEGFSHIRIVAMHGKNRKTFTFSSTATAAPSPQPKAAPTLASPITLRRAATEIR